MNKPHPPNKSIREVIAHFNPPFCLLTGTWRDTVGVEIYINIPRDQTQSDRFQLYLFVYFLIDEMGLKSVIKPV